MLALQRLGLLLATLALVLWPGPARAQSPSPEESPTASPSPSASPAPEADQVAVEAAADRIVAQVGTTLRYVITVTNPGASILEDVVVVDLVPAEIDVVGAQFGNGVEAVQIGEHKGAEDIVWVLAPLDPGASIELTWTGLAARPGDLVTANHVRVTAGEVGAETETTGYLAAGRPVVTENPAYRDVKTRVLGVVVRRPAPAAAAPGALLPVTGWSPGGYLAAGIALALVGGVLWGAAERRRAVSLLAVLCVILAACTSSDVPEEQSQPAPQPSLERQGEEGDRVLGRRIRRPERAPEEDEIAVPAPDPAPRFVRTIERRRQRVVVTAEDLPADSLGATPADNVIDFGWNELTRRVTHAQSGRVVHSGATAELLVGVALDGDALDSTATLRNTSEDRRLVIRGRLVVEVFDAGNLVARLRSEHLDVVLAPDGEVTAEFSFLLPDGEYELTGGFEPDQ